MKVYVLAQNYDYEGDGVYGVFSTEAKALAAIDSKDSRISRWYVYPIEIDGPPHWYDYADDIREALDVPQRPWS